MDGRQPDSGRGDCAWVAAAGAGLERFLRGEDRFFEFSVDSPPERRIADIHRVLFPGRRRLAFVGRFLVARLAQKVDWSPLKVVLYRLIGVRIGRGVYLSPDVLLDAHFPRLITLEGRAIIGWGARLFTHEFDGRVYRVGRIDIGEGAVIGGFATVRAGVRVGARAGVPANAFVRHDVPPGSSPAEVAAAGRRGGGTGSVRG